jgi:hypothetical protein
VSLSRVVDFAKVNGGGLTRDPLRRLDWTTAEHEPAGSIGRPDEPGQRPGGTASLGEQAGCGNPGVAIRVWQSGCGKLGVRFLLSDRLEVPGQTPGALATSYGWGVADRLELVSPAHRPRPVSPVVCTQLGVPGPVSSLVGRRAAKPLVTAS